jgi:hypothetical protein
MCGGIEAQIKTLTYKVKCREAAHAKAKQQR